MNTATEKKHYPRDPVTKNIISNVFDNFLFPVISLGFPRDKYVPNQLVGFNIEFNETDGYDCIDIDESNINQLDNLKNTLLESKPLVVHLYQQWLNIDNEPCNHEDPGSRLTIQYHFFTRFKSYISICDVDLREYKLIKGQIVKLKGEDR